MILSTFVECPYCKKEIKIYSEKNVETLVVKCKVEDGGCNALFEAHCWAKLAAYSYKVDSASDVMAWSNK